MTDFSFRSLVLSVVTGGFMAVAAADIVSLPFVSPMFGDHMVLQRGKSNTIWGWTTPGETVRVEIAGQRAAGVAGADGRWLVRIQPPASVGPHSLEIFGPQTVRFGNVLVGDVWLCGGQSNMELPLSRTRNGDAAIAAANQPEIRLLMAIDLGDANDIHPKDKMEVGERLALLALAKHYGKQVPFSGPRFVGSETIQGALKLRFDQSLVVKGDRPEEFAIAGKDLKWHWADARIVRSISCSESRSTAAWSKAGIPRPGI